MSDAILERAASIVRDRIAVDAVRVERVTVGDAAVLVELEGVCATDPAHNSQAVADRDEPSEGQTAGVAYRPDGPVPSVPDDADTVLSWLEDGSADEDGTDRVKLAVAIATLNALSAPLVTWRAGDPMALLGAEVDAIATVGLFEPAFRRFDGVDVRVIERRTDGSLPETPAGVTVSLFEPSEAEAALDSATVVFVTGSALLFGGVDRYLERVSPAQTVVLIGATASFVPEAAFAAGVDVFAGAAVTDRDGVRAAVEAGGCGTDLHDAGLEKGYVLADTASGVALKTLERE